MGAGLVGDHVRAHATLDQLRQDFCRVATQGNRDGFAFGAVLFQARQSVIQIGGLLIDIASFQAEIDAALLAFDVQRAGPGQGSGQWLCATHATQPGGQHPAAFQAAVVMLAASFDEGLVSALHDALATDVNPAASGHLAIHRQALGIQFVKVFPGGPVRHQVGVGNQYARGVTVRFEHADRLAGLHQQGFVVFQGFEGGNDLVVTVPITGCAADTAINDQFVWIFSHFRIQVVHQHAQWRFGQPAFGV
ncbi:hypothetical protein D3C79_500820 [compost metagenome]